MLIKGKKGDATQQTLFYAAELAVGAIVIILLVQVLSNATSDANAQFVAKDFALTVKAVSIYPYTTYLEYSADLSSGSLSIDQEKITVSLDEGRHEERLNLMDRIKVQEAFFFNPLSIPIVLMQDEISFGEDEITRIQCEHLFKFNTDQKFFIKYDYSNNEEKRKLELLKEGIDLLKDSKKISISNNKEDAVIIEIAFNKESSNTTIIFDKFKKGHETFECYAYNDLVKPEFNMFTDIEKINKQNTNMTIKIPAVNSLNQYLTQIVFRTHRESLGIINEVDLMQTYSKIIFEDVLMKMVLDE